MDIRVHAVDRYIRRFAPQMSWDHARARIVQLIADADFVVRARDRVNYWGDGYIVVTDGERVITVEERQRGAEIRKGKGLEARGQEKQRPRDQRSEGW